MTENTLICYSFEKLDPAKRKQFDRKMFGTIENTHKGKYQTKTKGILTNKKFRRPVRSVIILEYKYLKIVKNLLTEFSAKTEIYKIKRL